MPFIGMNFFDFEPIAFVTSLFSTILFFKSFKPRPNIRRIIKDPSKYSLYRIWSFALTAISISYTASRHGGEDALGFYLAWGGFVIIPLACTNQFLLSRIGLDMFGGNDYCAECGSTKPLRTYGDEFIEFLACPDCGEQQIEPHERERWERWKRDQR